MRILLTGANGLLGNNLTRELLARNYEVTVLLLEESLSTPGLDGLPVQRCFGNILDKEAVDKAVSGHDMVIHAAASTQVYPPRDEVIREVNITGTGNVIEACLKHKVIRLVHVGSAISFAPGTPLNPGDENGGYTGSKYGLDYFDSKYEAQKLLLKAVATRGLDAVVVNPTFMIGPYDTRPSSGAFILALYNRRIPVYTQGSKTYIAVKDAAVAIANSLTMGQAGECYILGNFSLTYKQACEQIAEVTGVDGPRFTLPSTMVKIYGIFNSFYGRISGKLPAVTKEIAWISCEDHCYSGEKAREKLHMPRTSISIAISECFEWFRQNGFAK